MIKQKQPNPISEGWDAYCKLVDEELKKEEAGEEAEEVVEAEEEKVKTHTMIGWPHIKCISHKNCHLNSFYPGKLYRAMEMEKDEDGFLKLVKEK